MSKNGKPSEQPYMHLSNWISGKCVFWREVNPQAPGTGYNVSMYEAILAEAIKKERNLSKLNTTP